tara:strand:- start:230 stop:511 length:282 start_codon:yes stop_codon:yes gene_type:complete
MATHTWSITDLKREIDDGYVYQVFFKVSTEVDGKTYTFTSQLHLDKPSSLDAYADLTEAKVIDWVKARLIEYTGETTAVFENRLAGQANGVPW